MRKFEIIKLHVGYKIKILENSDTHITYAGTKEDAELLVAHMQYLDRISKTP